MVDGPGPRGDARCAHPDLGVAQQLVVMARAVPALFGPEAEPPQLHAEDPRLDRVEPAVVPLHLVDVLPGLAVVAQHAAAPGQLLVVGRDGAGLAAGTEVLAGIE